MKLPAVFFVLLMLIGPSWSAEQTALSGPAAQLYRQAQGGRWFADADKLQPEILPTADGRSFVVLWAAPGTAPTRWIVSLPGTRGFATDDLALWYPHLKNRPVGLLSLQWWIGPDDSPKSYYAPRQIYREIDLALQKRGVAPGRAMLHGFSRGSTNTFALTALDAGRGKAYFALAVASSGGVNPDYPPTRAILAGEFGDHPLRGTRWITVAGAQDQTPERDGIPGMRRTAAWLREQGASVVESIEDPNEGHGALMRNAKNARRVLDLFLD